MADINWSIADLFERIWGYKTEAFSPEFAHVVGNAGSLSDRVEQGNLGSAYYAIGAKGREYYMPVTVTYPDPAGSNVVLPDGSTGTGVLKTWNLPYPVISVTSKKTIVETALTERRGTVKELINIEDYVINIKGFIIGQTNEFPENDVTELRGLYEQNVAIGMKCPLTDIFLLRPDRSGSDSVVIKELHFPEVRGIKNVRPYELLMVSDEPFNLTSIN